MLKLEYDKLFGEMEQFRQKKTQEKNKEIRFNEKIDELNQETDTLLEEIDKWEM